MAVVWGLDLTEIKWSKFKSSYMWNNDYHLRRTKFIVYQLAMILCVVSESLGTASLSDYVDQQKFIKRHNSNAIEHNNDFVGIASFNIFSGIFVATIFGAAFFFDLFWPERHESKSVRISWKVCAILSIVMGLADALALTVIVAKHRATITGVSTAVARELHHLAGGPSLIYKDNARAVASVVFLWLGWIATIAR